MNVNLDVDPHEIRVAARHMRDVAETVQDACPSKGLDDVADALVGSQSASAVAGLRTAWTDRFKNWSDDGMENHDALVRAADYYEAADREVAEKSREVMKQFGLDPDPHIPPAPSPIDNFKNHLNHG